MINRFASAFSLQSKHLISAFSLQPKHLISAFSPVCCLLLFLLLVLAGCGGKNPYVQEFSRAEGGEVRSIAVLPFVNRSGYGQGEKIVHRLVAGELAQQCNWRVALEGDIMKIYRQMRLRPWETPSIEQMQVIGARLGVDLLVAGTVVEMEEKVTHRGVDPVLSFQLRIYDGKSGALRWSTLHRRQGDDYQQVMHFGMINTVSAVGRKMVQEIFAEWKKKALLICSE